MSGVSRRFQAVPRHSRLLQGPAGASRGLRESRGSLRCFMRLAACCQSLEPWARLKFHAGWSGWTSPPTMAAGGGWGVARLEVKFLNSNPVYNSCLKHGAERGCSLLRKCVHPFLIGIVFLQHNLKEHYN